MSDKKNILIVAGEESGDQHAALFVTKLKQRHPDWHFNGVGGQHLQKAGMNLLFNLAQYGVTGISEVIKHLRIIRQAFAVLKDYIKNNDIDLVILVDYPGFNLRLAKTLKAKTSIPVVYYIGPQIWAWKANRIHHIKKTIDHMAVIFPFEKEIYQAANIPVTYVGHPLTEELDFKRDQNSIRHSMHLPLDKKIIALLPGSRPNEIQRLMPVLVDTMRILSKRMDNIHFALPIAASISPAEIEQYLPLPPLPLQIFNQQSRDIISASDLVIVASGTASLECALLQRAGCIIYKVSTLTGVLASQLIKIPYLGLANIISKAMVMPELLQDDCNAEALANCIQTMLDNTAYRQSIETRLSQVKAALSQPEQPIDQLIEQVLTA